MPKPVPISLLILLCLCSLFGLCQKQTVFSRPFHPAFQKASIKSFIEDINLHSGILIEYASSSVDMDKIIQLTDAPTTLGTILKQVLHNQRVVIVESNGKLMLLPTSAVLNEAVFARHFSVYGIIKESIGKETLSDASIWEPQSRKGTLSNNFGYFTLLLPEGSQDICISYAGFTPQKITVDLNENKRLDVLLVPNTDIAEVSVASNNGLAGKTGGYKLDATNNPQNIIMGETDVLRSLYLLPGVQNAQQVTNGMLVRGGSPDQNVFLLDGNPIFNPTHLLGTISIVNSTSLKTASFYKSNFPARFGGGLSSVLDVSTKDGNMKTWKGEANAGFLASSFSLEGPLVKDKLSMMFSVRRSWINPLLRLLKSGIAVNFYDIHFKTTWQLDIKDKLMLNVYSGHDKMYMNDGSYNNRQRWGNKAASLVWNRLLGQKAFINSSLNITGYNNIAGYKYSIYDSSGYSLQVQKVYNTFSSIQQYNAQSQLEISTANDIKMNMGAKLAFTSLKPFNTNFGDDFMNKPGDFNSFPSLSYREAVVFYEAEIKSGSRLFLRPGLHFSHYEYNGFQYNSWQPRFYGIYKINNQHQFQFSFNHMTQYLHLLTNPYLGINSDAWIPSTSILKPEESNLINFGYSYQNTHQFIFTSEIYYKQLQHVTNYVEGKNLFLSSAEWESNVEKGKGWNYGLELKAEKKTAKWQTHIAYTLSWNWRQFADINEGKKFPFKYDRRHMLNLAATYLHRSHWSFSGLWTFATGDVFTLPDRIYLDFDAAQQIVDPLAPKEYRLVYHSSATNQYRTLPYHRLDISASYHQLPGKKIQSVITCGIYNIYGSPSQYLYDIEGTLGKRSLFVSTQYKLFSVTPYLSYTVSF